MEGMSLDARTCHCDALPAGLRTAGCASMQMDIVRAANKGLHASTLPVQ
jgi:hypothetical protein